MYLTEFVIGSFAGILVMVCLLTLATALARREKTESAAETVSDASIYASERKADFIITRQEIADDVRSLGNPDITVIERRHRPLLPTTLRYKNKAYAMLYGTDRGVLMIVKLESGYAGELANRYPGVRRAGFPRAADWYSVPIGAAFTSKDDVYRILETAITD